RDAQTLLDGNRNAELRIQNQELEAADRYLDEDAGGGVGGIAAGWNVPLWSRAVQRESAQGASSAGVEQFAHRNMAASKCLGKAEAEAVGPNDSRADIAVKSRLSSPARKVRT